MGTYMFVACDFNEPWMIKPAMLIELLNWIELLRWIWNLVTNVSEVCSKYYPYNTLTALFWNELAVVETQQQTGSLSTHEFKLSVVEWYCNNDKKYNTNAKQVYHRQKKSKALDCSGRNH